MGELPVHQTHRSALTVAGQWRIFTAFPNIPMRFLTNVAVGARTNANEVSPDDGNESGRSLL
jgi:hypothetical protein